MSESTVKLGRNGFESNKSNFSTRFVEMLFQHFAEQQAGMEWLSSFLNVGQSTIFAYIGSLTGTDYHDWFEELRKLFAVDGKTLVRAFYTGMKGTTFDIDAFIAEIKECL